MNVLKLYRWGLALDVFLALFGLVSLNAREVSGACLTTALVHSIVASLIYFRGKRHGRFTKMDHAFMVFGQIGILLFLVMLFQLLMVHYFHASAQ